MRAHRFIATAIMLLLSLQLQGCGRKGPLYLQQKPAAAVQSQPALPPVPPQQAAGQQTQPAENAVIPDPVIQNTTEPSK